MSKYKLRKQLRQTGAGEHEADELTKLASSLGSIKTKGLTDKTKQQIFDNIGGEPKIQRPMRLAFGGLATAVFAVAVFSLLALPNQKTNEIDRGTEQNPSTNQVDMEEEMVMEQLEEVEKLKEDKASPEEIKQAEDRLDKSVENLWRTHSKEDDKSNYWDWWRERNSSRSTDTDVNGWSDSRNTERDRNYRNSNR